jgi:hypothetical protein
MIERPSSVVAISSLVDKNFTSELRHQSSQRAEEVDVDDMAVTYFTGLKRKPDIQMIRVWNGRSISVNEKKMKACLLVGQQNASRWGVSLYGTHHGTV